MSQAACFSSDLLPISYLGHGSPLVTLVLSSNVAAFYCVYFMGRVDGQRRRTCSRYINSTRTLAYKDMDVGSREQLSNSMTQRILPPKNKTKYRLRETCVVAPARILRLKGVSQSQTPASTGKGRSMHLGGKPLPVPRASICVLNERGSVKLRAWRELMMDGWLKEIRCSRARVVLPLRWSVCSASKCRR